jgi:hypothetical protein
MNEFGSTMWIALLVAFALAVGFVAALAIGYRMSRRHARESSKAAPKPPPR